MVKILYLGYDTKCLTYTNTNNCCNNNRLIPEHNLLIFLHAWIMDFFKCFSMQRRHKMNNCHICISTKYHFLIEFCPLEETELFE